MVERTARRLGHAAFGAILAALAGGVASAGEAAVDFGDLVLRYDPAIWEIAPGPGGFSASCRHADCKGRTVFADIRLGADCGRVAREPEAEHGDGRETRLESGVLVWRVETWFRGCRNAHPRSVVACTVHAGRAYRIAAPLASCRTAPLTMSESRIVDLIRALAPR